MASDASIELPSDASADLELVRRARRGEQRAVDQLVARLRFARYVLRHKNSLVGWPLDDAELEDVLQDTLLAVWNKLERFEGYGRLEAWVYRFITLEFMARLRRRRRGPDLMDDLGEEGSPAEPEAAPARQEIEDEHVYQSLEALGPPENEVIALKLLEDLTFPEIAARLSISPNTAKARYYRGLVKLRSLIPWDESSEGKDSEDNPDATGARREA